MSGRAPLGTCLDVTYVREARVGEGPGEGPATRVALDELCECIIRYLRVTFFFFNLQLRVSTKQRASACAYRMDAEERHERCQRRLFAEHGGVPSMGKDLQRKAILGEGNEGTHWQRSRSSRLSSIILLTKPSSPPAVIISTSAPVQTYRGMIW